MKKIFIFILSFIVSLAASGASLQADLMADLNSGPTLHLEYNPEQLANSVDVFMYFLPLNSLSAVSVITDPNTNFSAGVVNWHRKDAKNKNFTLYCDFEVTGSGLYKVVYDPDGMINLVSRGETKEKKITGLLDWIQFDGSCLGRIEASGRILGNDAVIEEVSISFNAAVNAVPLRSPFMMFLVSRINTITATAEQHGCTSQYTDVSAERGVSPDERGNRLRPEGAPNGGFVRLDYGDVRQSPAVGSACLNGGQRDDA
jgi:hypothetical protein